MTRLAAMLAERGLEAHSGKTGYLVFGSEKFKEEVEEELELVPLQFGEFKVVRKESDFYRVFFLTGPPLIWLSPRTNSKIREKKLEYGIS